MTDDLQALFDESTPGLWEVKTPPGLSASWIAAPWGQGAIAIIARDLDERDARFIVAAHNAFLTVDES